MAYHLFTIPCLRVIRDKKNNLSSVIDIVESVFVSPASADKDSVMRVPTFMLYSKWGRTDNIDKKEEFEIKLKAVHEDKDENIIELIKFPANIPENSLGMVLELEIAGMNIPRDGIWNIVIEWKKTKDRNWKTAIKLPILTKEKTPTPQNLAHK